MLTCVCYVYFAAGKSTCRPYNGFNAHLSWFFERWTRTSILWTPSPFWKKILRNYRRATPFWHPKTVQDPTVLLHDSRPFLDVPLISRNTDEYGRVPFSRKLEINTWKTCRRKIRWVQERFLDVNNPDFILARINLLCPSQVWDIINNNLNFTKIWRPNWISFLHIFFRHELCPVSKHTW